MNPKTAILIFANSAEKEAERKPFLSKVIFDALNKQTLKTVEKANIPYFLITEKQQTGTSFGERFYNAISLVFNKGFQNVITIGNDTPHLKTHHLVDTLKFLEKKELVLGPSKDGGFYLMAFQKNYFNKEHFISLPWQTNGLHHAISKAANAKNTTIQFLLLLSDLDCKEDIQAILKSVKQISYTLLKLLHAFCIINKSTFKELKNILLNILIPKNFNKGSPLFFAYI